MIGTKKQIVASTPRLVKGLYGSLLVEDNTSLYSYGEWTTLRTLRKFVEIPESFGSLWIEFSNRQWKDGSGFACEARFVLSSSCFSIDKFDASAIDDVLVRVGGRIVVGGKKNACYFGGDVDPLFHRMGVRDKYKRIFIRVLYKEK